ncbi:carboxypeptidase A [Bacillus phage poppyseed]|uniref:Carboxypeptidase A n=4 Tax=Pagevirus TaxID=1921184 RepID=A0A0A0RPY5_9CAUD|nr:zinc carboxypeptidase [Bacillus phage Page]YP_008771332.1 zinc carboxypeptidase [Bacillus phage Pony]YP_009152813.1 zinc carboxypeptidase [Bacillus phage Pookie]AGY48031.1 carboxypeptidase A [Bacillus phage poppyseed]AGY47936.1 carboxypeptidase [Bacillus phage Page]AGY48255.1 carboxypeptidase A [Bacillus phage Pony]AIW03699.1 carboxypeptidase A [Bacillus phage Pookie]
MPTIDLTTARQQGNEVALDFLSSVSSTGETYVFPDSYYGDSLKIENMSSADIYVSVGSVSNQLVRAFEKYNFGNEKFNQFFVKAASGMGSFRVRLSHFEYDEPDEKGLDTKIEKAKKVGSDASFFWLPPTQPGTNWGENGVPTSKDPEGVINALYEPLRAYDPTYIKRYLAGTSTVNNSSPTDTGVYNIYRYEFTPENYTKTIILSSGTHGNEYTAFFTLWRFLNHLVRDWEIYPQLKYARQNVRFIIMPINNPWGFKNVKRQNANLVDLNRNTDYLWNYITSSKFQPGGANYKGPSPFSEKESQIYRDTLNMFPDALAAIDFHTIITVAAEHIVYTPRYITQNRRIFNDVIDWLYKQGNRIVNGTSAVPTLSCWAASTHGMTVANPEWFNGLYGANRNSTEMTECLKFFGNVALQACTLTHKAKDNTNRERKSAWLMYDKKTSPTPLVLTSTIFSNFKLVYQWEDIKRHGVLRAEGRVTFTISAPCTVSFNPTVYQSYHPEMSWTNTKDADTFTVSETYAAAGTYSLPLKAFMNVFPTNYNETGAGETQRTAEAKFRLRGKSTAGSITIERARIELSYEQTDQGIPVKYVNYTGLEASPEGSDFNVDYPDPAKFVDDMADDD